MPPLELIIIWKNQSRFTPTVLVLIMLDDNWIHEFLGTYYTSVRLCSRQAMLAKMLALLLDIIYLNGTVSRARAPRRCVSPTTRF